MSTHSSVYVNNDSMLVVDSLRDIDGNLVTTATVTLESLEDRSGTAVSGVPVPSALTNLGTGSYEFLIPSTAVFKVGRVYLATVKAVTTGGLTGEWTETLIAKNRVA